MADQQTPKTSSSNDEIDLGQLFQMIGNGLNKLFNWFLGVFIYFKKNFFILLALVIVGGLIAFGLNQIVVKNLKTEVIVKPNLESKGYLYDVVNEIQSKIKANDTTFFSEIGIKLASLKGYEISIDQTLDTENPDNDLEYLELLEKFQDNGLVTDIIRTEILNKSSLNHRITFLFKDAAQGEKFSQKVMQYINSNSYYSELTQINQTNAQERIKQDEALISQIDGLIKRYSDKMTAEENQLSEQRIVLDGEKESDIVQLLGLKNNLIRDIERKKIELREEKEAISIINFGKPHEVQKPFFGQNFVLIPLILIAIYFFIDIIKFLNRKTKEI